MMVSERLHLVTGNYPVYRAEYPDGLSPSEFFGPRLTVSVGVVEMVLGATPEAIVLTTCEGGLMVGDGEGNAVEVTDEDTLYLIGIEATPDGRLQEVIGSVW